MMEISYLGQSCFRIKGRQKTLLTDPYGEKIGKFPRDIEADIITVSHDHFDHNATDKVKGVSGGGQGKPFIIDGPGEFEIGGVSVIGVAAWHDDKQGSERGKNTIYVFEIEGLRIAHLGDLGHKLTDEQLGEMGSIDIAMVPVGGKYTIDAKTAKEVTGQIDPWIVIPMHYALPDFGPKELATVDGFLKEMEREGIVPIPKLVVSPEKLPGDLQVAVLERKS
jgi:L-ascorbate metabolism protein UlaG (beta-lactamase superfamily)